MGSLDPKPIPEVDVGGWSSALCLDDYAVDTVAKASPKGTPVVVLSAKRCLLLVWGELHSDGVMMFFVARPSEKGSPVICMKFKEWKPERAMAAIVAVMAYHAEKPRLPRKQRLADEWLRKMRDRIQKHFYRGAGSFLSRGICQPLVDLERKCEHRFNCLAGLDVVEATERVRKDFRLLIDHMEEDEILSMWREAIVTRVLRS